LGGAAAPQPLTPAFSVLLAGPLALVRRGCSNRKRSAYEVQWRGV
jgi:hypothetical protein